MNSKWWLNSKTVRGALLTVIPTAVLLLKAFGVEIGGDEQTVIVDGISNVVDALAALVGIYGAIRAIIGRFNASREITFQKETK